MKHSNKTNKIWTTQRFISGQKNQNNGQANPQLFGQVQVPFDSNTNTASLGAATGGQVDWQNVIIMAAIAQTNQAETNMVAVMGQPSINS